MFTTNRTNLRAVNVIYLIVVSGLVMVPHESLLANDKTQDIILTSAGTAKAVIVISAQPAPAAKRAAKILQDHLFQMSGARLKIVSDQKIPQDRNLLAVGKSLLTNKLGIHTKGLGPGGFRIQSFSNAIALLGTDDTTPSDRNGTLYAVTSFLEEPLGCRFLWPGETGKVVPDNKSIVVAPINISKTPLLQQRKIRNMSFGNRDEAGLVRLQATPEEYHKLRSQAEATQSEDGGWFLWQRLGGSLGLPGGHSFANAWKKWSKKHPEWFALQPNGSRDQSQLGTTRSRLCVSNSELIEAIAKEKIEELNLQGARPVKAVAIGPNDGGRAAFCTCEKCKQLDPPEGKPVMLWDFTCKSGRRNFEYVSLTDRYVWFWNQIAQRVCKVHPKAWLTADAYSVYSNPPVKRELHPNISIRFVGINYLDNARRQSGRSGWDAWAKKASKMYFRPNLLLAARRQGTPVVYVHKLAEDFKYLAHHSMIGTDMDACTHHWATQGLNFYIAARLHWNPDLNIDAEIDDYCKKGFGDAALEVKKYFNRLEQLTNEIAEAQPPLHPTAPFTPEIIQELKSILKAADRSIASDNSNKKIAKRIAFLRRGLNYTEIHATAYRMLALFEANGGKLTPQLRMRSAAVLDKNFQFSREIFYHDFLAVHVSRVAWGGWGYFGRLGWRPPAIKQR